MKYSFCLAVETYQDPGIPTVKYAESDAMRFRSSLAEHGFAAEPSELLPGSAAVKAGIEAAIQKLCRRLKPKDTLWFFHAGQGFQRLGKSYFACRDTRLEDLPGTSLSLAWLVEGLRKTGCRQICLFLDASHDPWPPKDRSPAVSPGMADAEMAALFYGADAPASQASVLLVFLPCGRDESSHSSAKLRQGIWSHHLAEAMKGADPGALEKGRYLTAHSLQAYLESAVPKSVRTLLTGIDTQTPRALGDRSESLALLDFKRIFEARAEAESAELKSLEHAFFRGANSESVKRLSGWKKGFRLPDSASLSSTSFIQSLGAGDLQARFNSFHERIRKNLNYKRSAITCGESAGTFSCITPDFTFSISLGLDKEEPARYVESLILSEIRNPAVVASPGFGAVFNSEFDEVVLAYSQPFDIGRIIDAIEAMGNPKVGVEYPPDARECTVVFASMNIRLKFSGKTLVYAFASKAQVQKIMDAIRNAPRILGLDGMHA